MKLGIVGPSRPKWKNLEQYEGMKNWIRDFLRVAKGFDPNLTVVSGHCPVGEEREFCIDCSRGFDGKETGSNPFSWYPLTEAEKKRQLFRVCKTKKHRLIKVYTGGGVDTEAEIIANQLGVKTEIYPAEVHQWEDDSTSEYINGEPRLKGYRSRNIQIAKGIDVLYCIVPFEEGKVCSKHDMSWQEFQDKKSNISPHPDNGGCWTLREAKKYGKETHLVVIS